MNNSHVTFNKNISGEILREVIDQHGYAIVKNVLDVETLNELKQQINSTIEKLNVTPKRTKFFGDKTIRFGRLLWRIPKSVDLVKHPIVISALDEILLRCSPAYHLSFTGVMFLKEGQKAQVLHRDNTIFYNTPETPINLLATMWAIEDFKKENGATILVPGSHKWEEDRIPKKEELVVAEMPAGSVLFYAGNLIHGAGKCSSGTRLGVAIQYNLSWMNQEEPQFLAVPQEYAANNFDEQLLRLIGYDAISRNNGEIDSEHLLDFLLNDNKQRGLTDESYHYANGKCRKLFFSTGEINKSESYFNAQVDD